MLIKQPLCSRLLTTSTEWRRFIIIKWSPPSHKAPSTYMESRHGVLVSIMKDCHRACAYALRRKPPLCGFCGLFRQLCVLLSSLPALHLAIMASRLTLPALPSVGYVCILLLFRWFDLSPGLLFQLSQLLRSCLMVAESSDALSIPTIQKDRPMLSWGAAPW